MRRIARVILALLLLASIAVWIISARGLFMNPYFAKATTWSQAVIEAEITRAMTRTVTAEWIDAEMTEALSEKPRDWLRIKVIEELASDHEVPLTAATRSDRDQAYASDHGLWKRQRDCFWCAMNRANCALDATLICGLAVDLTSVGDIQSVMRAASAYQTGTAIDYFDAGLATLGLASIAVLQPQIKVGAAVLKTAKGARGISKPLEKHVVQLSKTLIRWDEVPRAPTRLSLEGAINPKSSDALKKLVSDAVAIKDVLPVNRLFFVLRKVDTPEEVRDLRRVAEVMDGKTPHAMEALGKGRLFRSLDRPTRLVAEAAAAVVALAMSIVLFAGHGLLSALLRTLRRIAR